MATIGTFTKTENGFTGTVKTLSRPGRPCTLHPRSRRRAGLQRSAAL
jgi:uncharacterized protein (DUF736 family)